MNSRLTLFETTLTGHHENYLEQIAKGLAQHYSVGIFLYIQKCEESQANAFKKRLNQVDVTILCRQDEIPDKAFGQIGKAFSFRKHLIKHLQSQPIASNILFIPYGDSMYVSLATLGMPKFVQNYSTILMRTPHSGTETLNELSINARIKRFLFSSLLRQRNFSKAFLLDPVLSSNLASTCGRRHASKISAIDDPACISVQATKSTARMELGLGHNEFVLLVYGVIDSRKGVEELIKASRGTTRNLTIIIAGKSIEAYEEKIASLTSSYSSAKLTVIRINKRITDQQEDILFAAADAVWVGYKNHLTMSGVLAKALSTSRWPIGCNKGLIDWYIRDMRFGCTVDIQNEFEVLSALESAQISPETLVPPPNLAGRFTWPSAIDCIVRGLRP